MSGVYFVFKTKYIESGIYKGVVKINGRIVTCIYNGDSKNKPFMISIYDHVISEVKGLRLGMISGVSGVSNMPYAAKVIMSKSEFPAKDVSELINKEPIITVLDDLSPAIEFQSKIRKNLSNRDNTNNAYD